MSLKNLGTEVAGQKDRGGEIIKSMYVYSVHAWPFAVNIGSNASNIG